MDENELIDSIKSKILENVDKLLYCCNDYSTTSVNSASIKNLVESYEILVNLQEENL